MNRQWYYRGSLRACNYSCDYCPFSKHRISQRELQEDERAFFRFVDCFLMRIQEDRASGHALQIVPYGEALVHEYYWRGLARVSRHFEVDAVGAQTNLSFPVEKMVSLYQQQGGDLQKLRLWCTYHPQMVSMEQFLESCQKLSGWKISYCVGVVGVPEHRERIQRLRDKLPEEVFLWINKMDGLKRNYTKKEIDAFLQIDPYFEQELTHHTNLPEVRSCGNQLFVEADGSISGCNLCRNHAGNIYDEHLDFSTPPVCSRRECSCYLSYCNRHEAELLFLEPYPAYRIPRYPRAAFFDIDGTLLQSGEKSLSDKLLRKLHRLAEHTEIYVATSLPYEAARRKIKGLGDRLAGGVFGCGGLMVLFEDKLPAEAGKSYGQYQCLEIPEESAASIRPFEKKYGFRLHEYRWNQKLYKLTLEFPRRKGIVHWKQQQKREFVHALSVLEQCQLLWEENCLEIVSTVAGKCRGVLQICEWRGYPREEVAVFGNSDQDAEMLAGFPFSVAVPGASKLAQKAAGYRL